MCLEMRSEKNLPSSLDLADICHGGGTGGIVCQEIFNGKCAGSRGSSNASCI